MSVSSIIVRTHSLVLTLVGLSAFVAFIPSQASAQGIRRVVETDATSPEKTPVPPKSDAPLCKVLFMKYIKDAAFSPDGKTFVCVGWSNGKELSFWNTEKQSRVGGTTFKAGDIEGIIFSPDSRVLATFFHDEAVSESMGLIVNREWTGYSVRLWDVATGRQVGPSIKGYRKAVFSPDSSILATYSDDIICFWNVATCRRIGDPLQLDANIKSIAFSSDGRVATMAAGKYVYLLDVETGNQIGHTIRHDENVTKLAFRPDGRAIATGSGKIAHLWDAASGSPVGGAMQHENGVKDVVFSPDGRKLLTVNYGGTISLWDAETGKPIGYPMQHGGVLAFCADGSRLATGGSDMKVCLWDTTTGMPIGSAMELGAEAKQVCFSADGRTLGAASDFNVKFWDTSTSSYLGGRGGSSLDGNNRKVALSPDCRFYFDASVPSRYYAELDMKAEVWAAPRSLKE